MPELPRLRFQAFFWAPQCYRKVAVHLFITGQSLLPSDLRSRISELKRSAVRRAMGPSSGVIPDDLDAYDVDDGYFPPPSVIPRATANDARIRLDLSDVIEGKETFTPPGRFFSIDRDVCELMQRRGPELTRRFTQLLEGVSGQTNLEHDEHGTFQSLSSTRSDALAFVDIEATGFTPGTPLFLVGLILVEGGKLRVRQLLARDYTEEGALLFYLWKALQNIDTVVSFNGKSYDLPYIRDRMVYYGYTMKEGIAHIDLLHEGRRRYKDRLVNCKLQTLERAICGRGRTEDIPGAEIPEAYHNFVRTNNATDMRDIIHHNALDLVTMVEVVLFMLEGRTL